jgi:hypothetical protein
MKQVKQEVIIMLNEQASIKITLDYVIQKQVAHGVLNNISFP